jgi:hypothetical protein
MANNLRNQVLMKRDPEEEIVDTKEPRLHHKIEISKLRVQHCFGMSKMTVVDDNCNNCKCFSMFGYLFRILLQTKVYRILGVLMQTCSIGQID